MHAFLLLIYGFLAAAAALLLEVVVGAPQSLLPVTISSQIPSLTPSLIFLILAAFIEEGSKWIFFRQFFLRFREEIEFPPLFQFGFFFGLGFSLLELGLILFGLKEFVLLPLLGIVGLHLLTSLFFSYYLFRPTPKTLFHSLSLLLGMTLIHIAYNLFLA